MQFKRIYIGLSSEPYMALDYKFEDVHITFLIWVSTTYIDGVLTTRESDLNQKLASYKSTPPPSGHPPIPATSLSTPLFPPSYFKLIFFNTSLIILS